MNDRFTNKIFVLYFLKMGLRNVSNVIEPTFFSIEFIILRKLQQGVNEADPRSASNTCGLNSYTG